MSTVAFSVKTFERMLEAGAFDAPEYPRGVELIRGEIVPMSPKANPEHDYVINLLMNWSVEETSRDRVQVSIQNSIGLPEFDSVPSPDIMWVVQGNYRSKRAQSSDVLLLIEVAESSLSYDRKDKASLYAQSGIQDYWVVNLRDRVVEVHRKPMGDTYGEKSTAGLEDRVSPLLVAEAELEVASLWRGV